MRWIRFHAQVDEAPIDGKIRRKAVVVLHVARWKVLSGSVPFKFGEKIARALAQRIDKHIEAPAMGHADDALLYAVGNSLLDDGVHARNKRLAAFKAKALLADIFCAQMAFERFGCSQRLKYADASGRIKLRSRPGCFKLLLPPATLDRIRNMHVFDGKRAAIRFLQCADELMKRHGGRTKVCICSGKRCVEIVRIESIKGWIKFWDFRQLSAVQRIEVSLARSEKSV